MKNNFGGVCIGLGKNVNTNVLVVVIAVDYFAEASEEVLVKMTKGKPEKGQKNQFLGVYMTSEKIGIFTFSEDEKNL